AGRTLPSASLIKVPLAWQFLERQGALQAKTYVAERDICDPDGSLAACVGRALPLDELARRMIVESENNATNLLLDLLGGIDAANGWLHSHGCPGTWWRRRMLDFAARAAGRDNLTSASELAGLLWNLRRAGEPAALLRWLAEAEGRGKLEAGLPPDTWLAHKVGDLPDAEHDAGIIHLPGGGWYVLVVMAADLPDPPAARPIIAAISRLCWETLLAESEPGGEV
ncbi:MAG TPA: serine hydrolase, partial [Herpetosiphonaceae bacterium]|nr:serine hydrolase [Herpetosiphonaceae bacterium]